MPKVTIGLPVRNGGSELAVAIDSLLSQSFRDFILIISDNESDDQTAVLCLSYAERDDRIRYIRQPRNLGNPGNFRFTLMQAQTEYFMWAAHDDVWSPTFIEKNLLNLDRHKGAVASVSKVMKILPSGVRKLATGSHAIEGSRNEKIKKYFETIGDLSRFYAVFRTNELQQSFPDDCMIFGFDWIVMALNLMAGDHVEVDEVLLLRKSHPSGHYYKTLLKYVGNRVDKWIPYYSLTRMLYKYLPREVWRTNQLVILRLNLVQVVGLLRFKWPLLNALVKVVRPPKVPKS